MRPKPKLDWHKISVASHQVILDVKTYAVIDGKKTKIGKGLGQLYDGGDGGYTCRDGLMAETRYRLQQARQRGAIDLFDEKARKPGLNCLMARINQYWKMPPELVLHALDCIVGLPALVLDPDWYTGDWWQTSVEELTAENPLADPPSICINYYGADNTILYHPALLSIVTGLFRQALSVVYAHPVAIEDLMKLLPPDKVAEVLTGGDEEAALQMVKRARPWIQSSITTTRFPIDHTDWSNFLNLHKLLFEQGFQATFASLATNWSLGKPYPDFNGTKTYFSDSRKAAFAASAKKIEPAEKRILSAAAGGATE